MIRDIKSGIRKTSPYRFLREHFSRNLTLALKQKLRDELFNESFKPFVSYGHINVEEALFLAELVRNLDTPGPIIEIGTLFGWSTLVFVQAKTPERPVITVDNYVWNPCGLRREQHIELTKLALQSAIEHANTRVVIQDKNEFYRTYNGEQPAMVFVDADHSYEETYRDIEWARSVNTPIICGHDYHEGFDTVVRAVEAFGGARRLVGTTWLLASG